MMLLKHFSWEINQWDRELANNYLHSEITHCPAIDCYLVVAVQQALHVVFLEAGNPSSLQLSFQTSISKGVACRKLLVWFEYETVLTFF